MLLVHTQEVSADFTGFPLSVSIEPDCTCDMFSGCSECGTKTLIINAAERDDGAVAQRLTFRCRTDDLQRILREALDMLEPVA